MTLYKVDCESFDVALRFNGMCKMMGGSHSPYIFYGASYCAAMVCLSGELV